MQLSQKISIFSIALFMLIALISSILYRRITIGVAGSSVSQDLEKLALTKSLSLNSSVKPDIALAVKMVQSPLLVQYFKNPSSPQFKDIAVNELKGYQNSFSAKTIFWITDADKNYFFNGAYSYTVNPNSPDQAWYNQTLNSGKLYSFSVDYDIGIKTTSLWINALVFDENKKPLGIAGTGIELDDFISQAYKDLDPSVSLYFFNTKGIISGAADKSILDKKVTVDSIYNKIDISSLTSNLTEGEIRHFMYGNEQGVITSIPAYDWYLIATQPVVTGKGSNQKLLLAIFIGFIAVFALVLIIDSIFLRFILTPLNKLRIAMNRIAQGDYTVQVAYKNKDEIGSLCTSISSITESSSKIIKGVREQAKKVGTSTNEQLENMKKCQTRTSEIVTSLEAANASADEEQAILQQASEAVNKNVEDISDFEQMIHSQSESITKASEDIERLLSCVQSMNTLNAETSRTVEELYNDSTTSAHEFEKVTELLKKVAGETAKMLETNAIIQSITEQTNLLAMNASIEAAHAGEAGKGFAVVAGEIRKLAEQTRKQSEGVNSVIKDITDSITAVSSAAQAAGTSIKKSNGNMEKTKLSFNKITEIIGTEKQLSGNISDGLKTVTGSSEVVSSGFSEMKEDNGVIVTGTKEAAKKIEQLTEKISTIAGNAREIDTFVEQLSSVTIQNKDGIANLSTSLDSFTLKE